MSPVNLTSDQIARVAYAACNEAAFAFGVPRSPNWDGLSGDRQNAMLQLINTFGDDEKSAQLMASVLSPARENDAMVQSLCLRIVDLLKTLWVYRR